MKIDYLKSNLIDSEIKIHVDMTGPTDLIDNIPVTARRYEISSPDKIIEHIKQYKNVSFYEVRDGKIRYAVWN
mgnify:CR=1 FL=1